MSTTYQGIMSFVSEIAGKEGARPNPSFFQTLANQALHEIQRVSGNTIDGEWSTADGGLTLTNLMCPIPAACSQVTEVEWDGTQLALASIGYFNESNSAWRSNTGTPTMYAISGGNVYLDAIATPVDDPAALADDALLTRILALLAANTDEVVLGGGLTAGDDIVTGDGVHYE